jgi:hypothetical protein
LTTKILLDMLTGQSAPLVVGRADMSGAPEVDPQTSALYTGPFDAAFREAVRRRGLTLDRLRSHLQRRGIRIGLSSLSDWQHGRSRPASARSLLAVQALEEILGLRRAALLGLLPTPLERSGRTPPPEGIDERRSPLSELLRSLPDVRGDLAALCRRNAYFIDTNRRAAVVQGHSVVRARRDGVDRYVLRYVGDAGCVIGRVEFGELRNCRLGRVRRHVSEPMLAAELLFDTTLAAGETWVFGAEVRDDTGVPCTEVGHAFLQPEEQYVLEVYFDAADDPLDCHAYARTHLDADRVRTGDLTLSAHRAAHLVATGVRAGVIGIAWNWAS